MAYLDTTYAVDAVALVEYQKRKERQERNAKIIAGTLIAITLMVGVYYIFFYD